MVFSLFQSPPARKSLQRRHSLQGPSPDQRESGAAPIQTPSRSDFNPDPRNFDIATTMQSIEEYRQTPGAFHEEVIALHHRSRMAVDSDNYIELKRCSKTLEHIAAGFRTLSESHRQMVQINAIITRCLHETRERYNAVLLESEQRYIGGHVDHLSTIETRQVNSPQAAGNVPNATIATLDVAASPSATEQAAADADGDDAMFDIPEDSEDELTVGSNPDW